MNLPLQWVWENDPQDPPDDDCARCISARGERHVADGGQLGRNHRRSGALAGAPRARSSPRGEESVERTGAQAGGSAFS